MYCPDCGATNPEDSLFCNNCGRRLGGGVEDSAARPVKPVPAGPFAGKTCPYCLSPIKPSDMIIICDSCGMPHHVDCWREGKGCTTYGCRSRESSRPMPRTAGEENQDGDGQRFRESDYLTGSPLEISSGPKAPAFVIILIVTVVLFGIAFITIPGIIRLNHENRMLDARKMLRRLGDSQLAYSHGNFMEDFGSFRSLRDGGYLYPEATPDTLTEQYFYVFDMEATGRGADRNSFTIMAYPKDQRDGFLKTFAIREDYVVREYNPGHGNLWEDVTTWDPVL